MMRRPWRYLAMVLVLFVGGRIAAQVPTGSIGNAPPPMTAPRIRRDTVVLDSAKRDSLRADSIARAKPLVTWKDTDSVVTALLKRPGFRPTRYQGDRVLFDARSKALRIQGKPAAVGRDQTIVVGDTVIYNDSLKTVTALGDTVILHDPSQNAADVVSRGRVTYDIGRRRAKVSNITTSVESGEKYFISGRDATFVGDTSKARKSAFYVHDGIITSCDDSVPDYYFRSNEIKYVSKNLIVARPAVLYIEGVPVFWLPFLFQDVRSGRRSGFLPPRLGLSEFVRSGSGYRRHVDNLGYYMNFGNYLDGMAWIDWRSGARPTLGDPGYTRGNIDLRYRYLDRFITGQFAASRQVLRDGSTNTSVTWSHFQDFSQTSRLSSSINYVTNTQVQYNTAYDPNSVYQTIRSDVRYSRQIGPFSLDLGGNRNQYPGRSQVDENYPSLSLSSPTLSLNKWLDWTPSFNYSRNATKNNDQVGTFAYRYFTNSNGVLDSARAKSSTDNSQFSLNTPFSIKGFQVNASMSASSNQNNYPITRTFVDPNDTTQRINKTYARSYTDALDWQAGFSLPSFLNSTFRIRPDITFQNVLGGSYWVRTELSGGQFVHQAKRVSGGISMSPTLFALFPGFGPLSRIRHSITPTIQYSWAPKGHVNNAYLRALNQDSTNFLGNLEQSQITFGLSQVFEGKLKSDTGSSGEGRKIRLLSINTSSITYDFERARSPTHPSGITTENFHYDLSSDLLPGFTFGSDYSLFQGSTYSDTAQFKPYRTSMNAAFTLNGQSGIFAALSRLFGRAVSEAPPNPSLNQQPDDALEQRLSSTPVAGNNAVSRRYEVPHTDTWTTSINFSSTRQRPPKGGRVLAFDPDTYCNQYSSNPAIFNQCRAQVLLNPVTSLPTNDLIAGGAFVVVPPRSSLTAQSAFNITSKWSATWGTTYDVTHNAFASQQVTLQRDLHDWRAVFSFSSSPNGNLFFNFFIVNKAQSELQFPYNKTTYRDPTTR